MARYIGTTGILAGTDTSSTYFTHMPFMSDAQMADRARRRVRARREAEEAVKVAAPPHPDIDPNNPDDEGFVPVTNKRR